MFVAGGLTNVGCDCVAWAATNADLGMEQELGKLLQREKQQEGWEQKWCVVTSVASGDSSRCRAGGTE